MNYINQEHPEYVANRHVWKRYSDLYAGGEQFRHNAGEYLIRRNKEPSDVYAERIERLFYENYIGSIIDWFAATLMTRQPIIQSSGYDERAKPFYNRFLLNCDRKGTTISSFFRKQISEAMIYGKSYIAIDFPKASARQHSRAAEDALGISDAYLTDYNVADLINWSVDDLGRFQWVVLRTSYLNQPDPERRALQRETRWIYYDRQHYRIYHQECGEADKLTKPTLLDEGTHGLATQSQVPLFTLQVSDGLWLMNKAAQLQLEHFNKSNALSWALTMGLFATPVVYSDREWNQIVGDSYYIQLGPTDRFGWTEPEGHVFQIAADNIARLKEEIYRVCYQITQAGGTQVAPLQSGISKQRDFTVTNEILRAYGDTVKLSLLQVLDAVKTARQDDLSFDVSGLDDFDIGDFSAELEDATKLLALGIKSRTFTKQLYKRVALQYLADSRPELKAQISLEIDESVDGEITNEE